MTVPLITDHLLTPMRALLFLGAVLVSGCVSPGQSYASKHSELTPAQRQIMSTGKIPSGDAVAGLTHDEIKLAMGGPPSVFDKVNGQEAWSYLKKSTALLDPATSAPDATGNRSRPTDLRAEFADSDLNVIIRTTIYFQGDRATRAEVSQEKP